MPRKIDLFIIGAQKAGTTSLKNYLGEHPEMITHISKEFSFFYDDEEFSKGYENAFNYYFKKEHHNKIIVCKHAHLYSSEKAIERLKLHNPDCKIVFIMRNPVKRTLSSFLMEKLYNRVSFEFEELKGALDGSNSIVLEDWQYEAIIDFSLYSKHLETVYKYFSKEQVKLILFEDFSKYPLNYCKEIFASFSINDEFQPRVRMIHNRTSVPISKFYANFLKYFLIQKNPVKEGIKRMIPANTSAKLGEKLRDANKSTKNYNEMSEEMNAFLKQYFYTHNKKLEELTGFDISFWS